VRDIAISVSLCLSVRSRMSKPQSNFTKVHATCGHVSVLLWRQWNTLCTSCFVDVTFSHIGRIPHGVGCKMGTLPYMRVRLKATASYKFPTYSSCTLLDLGVLYCITSANCAPGAKSVIHDCFVLNTLRTVNLRFSFVQISRGDTNDTRLLFVSDFLFFF